MKNCMYKKKVKIGKVIICMAVIAAAAVIFLYLGQKKHSALDESVINTSEQVLLLEGQRIEKLKIKAIYGNEICVNSVENADLQEDKIWQIPVGTDVITKLGTTTTFSRLANADVIDVLIQADDNGNETIQKVWITE